MKHFICFIFTMLVATNCWAFEPINLAVYKTALKNYHDRGEYLHDFNQVIARAKIFLSKKIADNKKLKKPHRLALVLDIDDTAITLYQSLLKYNFGGITQLFSENLEKKNYPAITTTLNLYNYALKKHVAVFFVTGRFESLRNVTIKNLHHAGYKHWSGLILRPKNYKQQSVISYKSTARSVIEKTGFEIVATIGDQRSDLQGGYADKGFKLPNPYYFIP